MMPEISLNILDIVQNSITAEATHISIHIRISTKEDCLQVCIKDNGVGMTHEQITSVEDPFFTTRKTRTVGLGIPFFKQAVECTGGYFQINATLGEGTWIVANFVLSHIDRIPLGDINSTIMTLIRFNREIDFQYFYQVDERSFTLNTIEMKEILLGVSLNSIEVTQYLTEYLAENKKEADANLIF